MHLSLCLSNAESPQPNELYDVDVGTRLASGSKTSSGCVLTREAERQSGLVDEERDMVQVDPRRWTRSFRGPERGSPCEAVKQLTREAEPLHAETAGHAGHAQAMREWHLTLKAESPFRWMVHASPLKRASATSQLKHQATDACGGASAKALQECYPGHALALSSVADVSRYTVRQKSTDVDGCGLGYEELRRSETKASDVDASPGSRKLGPSRVELTQHQKSYGCVLTREAGRQNGPATLTRSLSRARAKLQGGAAHARSGAAPAENANVGPPSAPLRSNVERASPPARMNPHGRMRAGANIVFRPLVLDRVAAAMGRTIRTRHEAVCTQIGEESPPPRCHGSRAKRSRWRSNRLKYLAQTQPTNVAAAEYQGILEAVTFIHEPGCPPLDARQKSQPRRQQCSSGVEWPVAGGDVTLTVPEACAVVDGGGNGAASAWRPRRPQDEGALAQQPSMPSDSAKLGVRIRGAALTARREGAPHSSGRVGANSRAAGTASERSGTAARGVHRSNRLRCDVSESSEKQRPLSSIVATADRERA
ncbi:hypothetical protein B0H14DRAFT_3505070 [Mycena olivaceomarginata]|nr:hypothetical protein B0H14DRAFT_3505070 [Mycena olivaceomarginata]